MNLHTLPANLLIVNFNVQTFVQHSIFVVKPFISVNSEVIHPSSSLATSHELNFDLPPGVFIDHVISLHLHNVTVVHNPRQAIDRQVYTYKSIVVQS